MASSLLQTAVLLGGFLFGAIPSLVALLNPTSLAVPLGDGQPDTDNTSRERPRRWFVFAFFVGCILTMPSVGALVDEKGPSTTFVILGSVLTAAILGFLAFANTYPAALTISFLLSFAFACFALGTLYLMPLALPSRRPSEALNLGFIPVALGALTAHVIYPFFEKKFGYRNTLLGLGTLCLLPGLMAALSSGQLTNRPQPMPAPNAFEHWRWYLFLAMMLSYFCLETTVEMWTEPYLKDTATNTTMHVTLFWLSFLAGRFVVYHLHLGGGWVYLVASAAIAVTLGNLAGAFGPSSVRLLGLHFAGFCLGPLFPGFLGVVSETYPRQQGVVMGWALALNGINHCFVEPFVARLASRKSAHHVFMFGALCAVVMAILFVVDLLLRRES
jgi:MFS family permease